MTSNGSDLNKDTGASDIRPRADTEELLAIGRRCAANLNEPPIDHVKLLYDHNGLPK